MPSACLATNGTDIKPSHGSPKGINLSPLSPNVTDDRSTQTVTIQDASSIRPVDPATTTDSTVMFIIAKMGLITLAIVTAVLLYKEQNDLKHLKKQIIVLKSFKRSAPVIFWALDSSLLTLGMSGESMNLLGGYLFGRMMGADVYGSTANGELIASAVCILSTFTGGTISFLMGRYCLRNRAMALKSNIWWQALDNIIERHGLILALALRFSPIVPFALFNLLLGASALSFFHYEISLIGTTPFLLFLVSLGAKGTSGVSELWHIPVIKHLLIGAVLFTVILTSLLAWILAAEIKSIKEEVTDPETSPLNAPLLSPDINHQFV